MKSHLLSATNNGTKEDPDPRYTEIIQKWGSRRSETHFLQPDWAAITFVQRVMGNNLRRPQRRTAISGCPSRMLPKELHGVSSIPKLPAAPTFF